MTLKHTLGPWKRGIVSDTSGDIAYIWPESNGHTLARVQGGNVTANSLLISAAPDLLAALQSLLEVAGYLGIHESPYTDAASNARLAIRKATGE